MATAQISWPESAFAGQVNQYATALKEAYRMGLADGHQLALDALNAARDEMTNDELSLAIEVLSRPPASPPQGDGVVA